MVYEYGSIKHNQVQLEMTVLSKQCNITYNYSVLD